MNPPTFTDKDHGNMDDFLAAVLDAYRDGKIDQNRAIATLAHVMAAIDRGNYAEARSWFEQGRKFIERPILGM